MGFSSKQQVIFDLLESQQAKSLDLSNPINFEEIKSILNTQLKTLSLNIPNQQPNAVSLFYAGDVGTGINKIPSWQLAVGMGEASPTQVIVLQDTELGKVINSPEFRLAIDDLLENANEHHRVLLEEIWDNASERMAINAEGHVRAMVPLTDRADKVFAYKELPALLQNPKVQSIEGIDINVLRQHYLDTHAEIKAINPSISNIELEKLALRDVQSGIAKAAREHTVGIEYIDQGPYNPAVVDSAPYFKEINPNVKTAPLPEGVPTKHTTAAVYEQLQETKTQRAFYDQGERAYQKLQARTHSVEHVTVEQLYGKITPPTTIDGQSHYVEELTRNKAVTETQLHDPMVQKIGGVNRTELVQTYDELIKAHQYSPEKALEAVNARVTFNREIEDIKAGKAINLTEDGVRSHAIVRQTATVIQDSPLRQQLDRELTASYRIMNQATPELVHHALHPAPSAPHPPTPFQQAYRSANVELEQMTQRPNSILTRQTNAVYAAEHHYSVEKQAADAEVRIQRAQQISELAHTNVTESAVLKTQTTADLHRSPHMGGKVMGVAGVAVEMGLGAMQVNDAVQQAKNTLKQNNYQNSDINIANRDKSEVRVLETVTNNKVINSQFEIAHVFSL